MGRPNLADQKHWVKVSDQNNVVYFETFSDAAKSEIQGNLMSLTYYEYHYSKM